MQFSAVEIRFIVTTYLNSTFTNDLKRKKNSKKTFIVTDYAALKEAFVLKYHVLINYISLSEIKLGKPGCSTEGSVNSCENSHAVCNSQETCECNTRYYDSNGASEFGSCVESKHFIFYC